MLKLLSLLTFTSIVLAGCTPTQSQEILPEQTYQGYPCFETCEDFKNGFDTARSRQVKSAVDCTMSDINERSGCKAYVAEEEWRESEQSDLFIK